MKNHIETLLVQGGNRRDERTGSVSLPIYLSTAFEHKGIGQSSGYDYSRTGNPTRSVLEDVISELEEGYKGFAFSSGMAAITAVLTLFSTGDELIVSEDLYGGSYRLFVQWEKQYGLTFHFIDTRDTNALENSITPSTKGIILETPTNPMMNETSITNVAKITREKNILLIVDNTFFTPVLQKPIVEGADIVVHSATKYLGGHNDVLAGLVVAKDEMIAEQLCTIQNSSGAVLGPFDCWLLLRGLKTLHLRMAQHEKNAKRIVEYLYRHPSVEEVFYPGKGGMLSFRIQKEEWIPPFLKYLQIITFAESLGGVESFITYPALQTHGDIPEETRFQLGICNRLLRFSVGIENVEDLIGDLERIFQQIGNGVETHE
ncbi:methionine biosynthesis PLP-dependent protein [Rossellomorea aquimaris]|uniref:methionine biosynthesis PLP-dependent protein n=1 Tax=Rossellomorea aquimaris TaxID=189382 RepID=UPI0007D05BCA|nr:methionine biosynthesis PLP-dependent protein [Rossellomorea aquimaris]